MIACLSSSRGTPVVQYAPAGGCCCWSAEGVGPPDSASIINHRVESGGGAIPAMPRRRRQMPAWSGSFIKPPGHRQRHNGTISLPLKDGALLSVNSSGSTRRQRRWRFLNKSGVCNDFHNKKTQTRTIGLPCPRLEANERGGNWEGCAVLLLGAAAVWG